MTSPMRQSRRQSQALEEGGSPRNRVSSYNNMPAPSMAHSRIGASRIANTQPTYDFLTGTPISPPVQSLQQTFRQSQVVKAGDVTLAVSTYHSERYADIGNEDLRAQIKTLQYELEAFRQEREFTNLRHEKELRDVQVKAESDFKKAQASESSKHVTSHKYDALSQELKETKNQAINQQQDLEKKLRTLQEQNRSLKEDLDEGQTGLSSLDRQYQYRLKEVESKHVTLQNTLNDLRADLENKSFTLQTTQEKLSQKETEVGHLESEVLRLKAQTGDVETLAVVKRELSETVAHIRKLESTNRDQSGELRHFRRIYKSVEIVEEEKRVLENKLSLMEDLRRDLREAQLQRQMLEDERQSWTSYLQNEGGGSARDEFESPEALARALVQQRLENASLVERLGAVQPELSEKEEIIRSLEDERNSARAEAEKLRVNVGGGSDGRTKTRLERQRALAVKEVDYLREQLRTFDTEEITYNSGNHFDEEKTKRIQSLEALVDQYRDELQSLNETLSAHEENRSKTPSSPISLKRPLPSDSPDERVGQLSRRNRKLADSLSALEQKHALLQSDHSAATTQLAAFKTTAHTRVLSLRENPTGAIEAIKLSTLTTLREENKALLARLEGSASPVQSVPLASLASARQEIQALEAVVRDKDKSMLRHMEAWSKTGHSLRLAVASLLGWQMDPTPGGKYRLTSIFTSTNPDDGSDDEGGGSGDDTEKDHLMFDGEGGKMTISGGAGGAFAHDIGGLVSEWVDERRSIPAFMAALTLDFYERTVARTGNTG
ncbi:coiled-coil domain-containing protein mad1 [Pseudocyphellaria aurata]|nr:coiled-coil domain-containing protein mad1 [Pseudocyphellaria aurata]